MNLGIVLPNWIGDAVMATPAIRALHRQFHGHASLIGIMRPYIGDVLSGTNWLDGVLSYDPQARDPRLRTWQTVRRLRALELDQIILLTNSLRTGAMAWLSGASQRIGFVRSGRGWMLTCKLYPPRDGRKFAPVSAVDYYLQLAYAVGCPPESRRLELSTLPADQLRAQRVWHECRLDDGRRVVIFNTGGAYGSAKDWPREYFGELAVRIATDCDAHVLVICGPAERQAAAEIVQRAGHPRVQSLAEQPLSIGLSKACIRRSQLLVSTDSGPRHIAAAFDVPTISLFGPTDPRWSDNYQPRAVHLQHQVPCGPCARRVCPRGHHECMRRLTVDRVYRAVTQQLETTRRVAGAYRETA